MEVARGESMERGCDIMEIAPTLVGWSMGALHVSAIEGVVRVSYQGVRRGNASESDSLGPLVG